MSHITNIYTHDGFGSSFQSIIFQALYAELMNQEFKYSPRIFTITDLRFPSKEAQEEFDKFVNIETEFDINKGKLYNLSDSHTNMYWNNKKNLEEFRHRYKRIEWNIDTLLKTDTMKKIKRAFWKGKTRLLDPVYFNICAHVRIPNKLDNRYECTDDNIYIRLLKEVKNIYTDKNCKIHIFSQDGLNTVLYESLECVLHIDESIFDSFQSFVEADVLICSRSSFSYCAGLLNENIVYYMPFMHVKPKHWKYITI